MMDKTFKKNWDEKKIAKYDMVFENFVEVCGVFFQIVCILRTTLWRQKFEREAVENRMRQILIYRPNMIGSK